MKLSFAIALLFAASSDAFAPSTFGTRKHQSSLMMAAQKNKVVRPDASKWIQQAVEATEKYGPGSPEARVAWEAVEELDSSSDNSEAFQQGVNKEECEVEEPSPECIAYSDKLEELNKILAETAPMMDKIKELALDVQAMKVPEPPTQPGTDSPTLQQSLKNAKEATETFGADSTEAKLAWAEVEEVASSGSNQNALGGMLDEECLVETIEACDAINELQRAIHLKKAEDRYQG